MGVTKALINIYERRIALSEEMCKISLGFGVSIFRLLSHLYFVSLIESVKFKFNFNYNYPVSYTHLTLPTICSV